METLYGVDYNGIILVGFIAVIIKLNQSVKAPTPGMENNEFSFAHIYCHLISSKPSCYSFQFVFTYETRWSILLSLVIQVGISTEGLL